MGDIEVLGVVTFGRKNVDIELKMRIEEVTLGGKYIDIGRNMGQEVTFVG